MGEGGSKVNLGNNGGGTNEGLSKEEIGADLLNVDGCSNIVFGLIGLFGGDCRACAWLVPNDDHSTAKEGWLTAILEINPRLAFRRARKNVRR